MLNIFTQTFSNVEKSIARSMILVNGGVADTGYFLCDIEYKKKPSLPAAFGIYNVFLKSTGYLPHRINLETDANAALVRIDTVLQNCFTNGTTPPPALFSNIPFGYYLIEAASGGGSSVQNKVNRPAFKRDQQMGRVTEAHKLANDIFSGTWNSFPKTVTFLRSI
ncbi:MAG: hypothetical protein WCI11_02705 [Candidatus Methylumidiphilus sp.]